MLLLRVVATFTACAWAFAPSAPLSARRPSALMAESSVQERVAPTAANAAIAAAAVSKAVSTRETAAPDLDAKSYVAIDDSAADEMGRRSDARAARDGGAATGGRGRACTTARRSSSTGRRSAASCRSAGASSSGTRCPSSRRSSRRSVQGGPDELFARAGPLAKEAREDMEALGPTYIKLGQMMSVRPDVLPPEVLAELATLQDAVAPFDSAGPRARRSSPSSGGASTTSSPSSARSRSRPRASRRSTAACCARRATSSR